MGDRKPTIIENKSVELVGIRNNKGDVEKVQIVSTLILSNEKETACVFHDYT